MRILDGTTSSQAGTVRSPASARATTNGVSSSEDLRTSTMSLSLTRIELNEHVPPSAHIELEQVVRSAAAALQPLAQSENATIEIAAEPNLAPILGDRDELTQLFQNLIHNAIKYGRPGGHVWVGVSGRSGTVSVAVRDDGEGIPREAIPRLTERFYRVDVKRSRERGGTGLGLAIVKHIVNRHNGRLQIDSELGSGSTFTVTLPALSTRETPADKAVTEVL